MSTVGSLLISAREIFPDLPSTVGTPTLTSVTPTSGSLANQTWYFKLTATNEFGETIASSELSAAGTGFSVVFPTIPGATGYRVYFGPTAAGQNQYVAGTASPISVTAAGTAGSPPNRNTAWLPDTDGNFISVATLYRWLNEGLKVASRITGGIQDVTAVQANSNINVYPLVNQWTKITQAWFDGWPVALGGANDTFQRTRVTGIVGNVTPFKQNESQYFECWPIPNRTGVSTTVNQGGGIGPTDNAVTVAQLPVLPLGLIKIDSELIYYSSTSGNTLIGLVRGMGGTTAASHANAVPALECNLRFRGYRMPESYAVGSANASLTVPPAWEALLVNYLVAKFRATEQDGQTASQIMQEFQREMSAWAISTKPLAGPRQMGGSNAIETVPYAGSMGGGIIRL